MEKNHWIIELGILSLYIGVALAVSNLIYLIIKHIIQTRKEKKQRYFVVFYSGRSKNYIVGGYSQTITRNSSYINHTYLTKQLKETFKIKYPLERFTLIIHSILELNEGDYNTFNSNQSEYETLISTKGEQLFVRQTDNEIE